MAHFRLITPFARTLAIASLAGTALLAGTAVADQNKNKPPAAAAATSAKPETVEQRITTLKTALKITPDQEGKWNGVAQAMRDNAQRMEALVAMKRAIPADKTTAVEDLKTYQEFTETRLDGLKHLTSAFASLYDSMSPEQRKNADLVFERYVPPKQARQG